MKDRTLIAALPSAAGRTARFAGWIHNRRDHGKLVFLDIRDRSGSVQAVVLPGHPEVQSAVRDMRPETVVTCEGLVKERPGAAANAATPTGGIEVELTAVSILAQPTGELPFDITKADLDVNLATMLDRRNLALRHPKVNAVFRVYSRLLESYAAALRADGFMEIKSPKLLENASEGGANVFKVKYFDRFAYLAQSPQFYKQAGVGAFERVFEVGTVFRAEPHFTSRHVSEYVSLDAEMGFIDGFEDLMDQLERTVRRFMTDIAADCTAELAMHGATIDLPEASFPRIPLAEALAILEREYGKKTEDVDIDPEGERLICDYVKKTYGSDFVFLTHYPVAARPMYTMPTREGGVDQSTTQSFDLIYRGIEIATGGQRLHIHDELVAAIRRHGFDPEQYASYLEVFRYGMPPHGGWGMGSERIVQKILGLDNIREAILFPRDVKRLAP